MCVCVCERERGGGLQEVGTFRWFLVALSTLKGWDTEPDWMHSEYDEMAVIDGLDEVPVEISSLTRKVRSGRLLFFSWGWMWLRGWGDGDREYVSFIITVLISIFYLFLFPIFLVIDFFLSIGGRSPTSNFPTGSFNHHKKNVKNFFVQSNIT